MDDGFERTLLVLEQCFVYDVNGKKTNQGYRAKSWDLEHWLWMGMLKVVAVGDAATVRLVEEDGLTTFAEAPVVDGAVEPAIDSSRYFVLRIVDAASGKHAFIGIGFQDRNHAFDFNLTLNDHKSWVENKKKIATAPREPSKDYSLKEGQTIKVSLRHKPTARRGAAVTTGVAGGQRGAATTASSGGGLGALLPPPPTGASSRRRGSRGTTATAAAAPAAAPAAAAPATADAAAPDPFAALGAPTTSAGAAAIDWGAFASPTAPAPSTADASTGAKDAADPWAIFQ
ncbi:adaptin ear-binding coat-associated protein 2 [Thecamonas trahens ATCC 50062]|uniref:Adaptin ear-binding coat-associated protein 2 n=1 Tax=Thecamonas trahens ATCC 50062 TaxID=461836 RepID=A0A0L0DWP9_THETB|nr:adaptin ear-binding coat-associated protein 2 [Thecamonas trahens ATCC 50062]KNC55963.1 adaptin ear-binding coat-associated protein 2 [Thecamonas trahens ATCC 50062]|eukprot:XP_013761010.1 adaptin ear-binding coat-associated protein 2 [Thecamonas trahens ATCC 50062]